MSSRKPRQRLSGTQGQKVKEADHEDLLCLHPRQPPKRDLYVGVTNELVRRISQHREGQASSFTRKYKVTRLVYLEPHQNIDEAIRREKCLKKWRRQWKLNLIENFNPQWQDLWDEIAHGEQVAPGSRLAQPLAAWPG